MKDSAFENFSEKALEALDFARCQRADGSYYGTGGTCRMGAPADSKDSTSRARSELLGDISHAKDLLKRSDLTPWERARTTTIQQTSERELAKLKGDRDQRIQKALGSAQKRIDKLTARSNAMKPGPQKDKVQAQIAKLRKTQRNLVKTRGREGTNVPSRTEGFGPNIPTSRFD